MKYLIIFILYTALFLHMPAHSATKPKTNFSTQQIQELFCQLVYVDAHTRESLITVNNMLPDIKWSDTHTKVCADIMQEATVMMYSDVAHTVAESLAAITACAEHAFIAQQLEQYQRLLHEGKAHLGNWQLDENNQLYTRSFTDSRIILQLGVRSLTVEGTEVIDGLLLVNGILKVNGRIILNDVDITTLIANRSGGGGGGSSSGIVTIDGNTGSATGSTVSVTGGDSITTSGASSTLAVNVSGTTQFAVQIGDGAGGLASIGLGTAGQALTSTGTGAAPSFADQTGGSITITGDVSSISGSNLTFNALTEGGTTFFATDGVSTMTLNFTDANFNTFIGLGTQTGSGATNSTAVGQSALAGLTSGTNNTSLGAQSLQACTNGSNNTAVGFGIAPGFEGGTENTFVGVYAGVSLGGSSASRHTFIGNRTGINYDGLESNNICIGSNTQGTGGQSNQIMIGSGTGLGLSQINATYIAGIITQSILGTALVINSLGQLGFIASSKRFKENIAPMPKTLSENILKLQPVTFNYIEDKAKTPTWGLIAEEVEEIFPQLVIYDEQKRPHSVQYHNMPVLILNETKKLIEKHEKLQKQIAHIEQKFDS